MPDPSTEHNDETSSTERKHLGDKLSTIGWALFLIWVGVAFLLDIGVGLGVLGIGAITLGVQAARFTRGLGLEGFWVIVGLLFLVGGIWELIGIESEFPIVPVAFIVFGVALLWSIITRRQSR